MQQLVYRMVKFRGPVTKYVSREEWGALPPRAEGNPIKKPYLHVLFSYTHTDECHTEQECAAILRQFQKDCMENKGYDDMQYNFFFGADDGIIFEGRGWNISSPKPARFSSIDGKSIDLAYIGNYPDDKKHAPSLAMVRAASDLMWRAYEEGYLGPTSAEVITMRDISETKKPTQEEKQKKIEQTIAERNKKEKAAKAKK